MGRKPCSKPGHTLKYANGRCKGCKQTGLRKYRLSHLEFCREVVRTWRRNNPEKSRAISRNWQQNNPEKRREAQRKRPKTLNELLARRLRGRLSEAIKTNAKSGSAVRDLGCSIEYLKNWLEAKFKPGMTWENWGEWHIDHIVPLASFDLTDRVQLLKAVHYTNLQPLWGLENLKKGDR